MWVIRLSVAFVVLALVGCDTGPVNAPPPDADSPNFALKSVLQDVANTGILHDDYSDVHGIVNRMKETNPTEAERLSGELRELEGFRSNPEKLKAKAQEIISSL